MLFNFENRGTYTIITILKKEKAMYADSTNVKDTDIKTRISTKQKELVKKYVKDNNYKSVSDFVCKLIDKEINKKGETLFN